MAEEIEIVDEPQVEEAKAETQAPVAEATPPAEEGTRAAKRIRQLVARAKAAEERAAVAVEAASRAAAQFEELKNRLDENDKRLTREMELRNQYNVAQAEWFKAKEAGDFAAEQRAMGAMTAADAEFRSLKGQPQAERPAPQVERPAPQPRNEPPAEALDYIRSNSDWWGKDRIQTAVAVAISEDLIEEGFDPTTKEYYDELDKRRTAQKAAALVKPSTPTTAPSARAAPAPAPTPGKTRVTLTAGEKEMARRLGVSVEDYARSKAQTTVEQRAGGETHIWRAA